MTLYVHKSRGWQVRFTIYFPDGSRVVRYRYSRIEREAHEIDRLADFLERGSRAGNLSPREITAALHHGLLNDQEVSRLSGGSCVVPTDLSRVRSEYSAKKKITLSPYGYVVDLRRADSLLSWLAAVPLDMLTAADVRRYVLGRRSGEIRFQHRVTGSSRCGVSDKTIINELGSLQGLLDEAVALGMCVTNVARSVNVTWKDKKSRRSLDRDGIRALVAAADANRHLCHGLAYEMVMVALFAGLRRGEIRTLTWDDVDLSSRRIIIQSKVLPGGEVFSPKSGEVGYTTIPDRLADLFSGMKRRGRFVFGGDAPIHANRFYKTFKKLLQRAGLPDDLSLHHARHSYGSFLLKLSGGNLRYVQTEMRHLDLKTTKNYMHNLEAVGPAKSLDFGLAPVDK